MTELGQKRMKLHSRIVHVMQRANYQTSYAPAVKAVKRAYLQNTFGVDSSTLLDDEQLNLAITAWTHHLKIAEPQDAFFSVPTGNEFNKIVRLGKYKLGKVYGDDWFWRHLPDWSLETYSTVDQTQYPARKVRTLKQLSRAEAEHIIRKLEQIEYRVFTATTEVN